MSVIAVLRRRDDVALALDRPRPQQHVPVVRARRGGEGRRHGECRRPEFHQPLVEPGEAHVVAHGQPERAEGQFRHRRGVARRGALRLEEPGAVGEIDVEHVDLAIHGANPPGRVEVHAGVEGAPVRRRLVEPEHEVHAVVLRHRPAPFEDGAALRQRLEHPGPHPARADERERFRGEDGRRAIGRCGRHLDLRGAQVLLDIRRRAHLHDRGPATRRRHDACCRDAFRRIVTMRDDPVQAAAPAGRRSTGRWPSRSWPRVPRRSGHSRRCCGPG